MLVRFEETAEVEGLATPEVAVHGPVEGEFEGAAVEGAMNEASAVARVWAVCAIGRWR